MTKQLAKNRQHIDQPTTSDSLQFAADVLRELIRTWTEQADYYARSDTPTAQAKHASAVEYRDTIRSHLDNLEGMRRGLDQVFKRADDEQRAMEGKARK